MRTRMCVTALALSVLTAGLCRADDRAVRKELDAGYARMCQGVKTRDVTPMVELSTPDFTVEEGGRTQDAKAALAMLKQQFKIMQSCDSVMKIRTLKVSKGQAVATVDYSMNCVISDGQGKTHQIAGKGVDEDIWVKTKAGWRIKKVKTLKSEQTMDGKAMKQ